VAEQIPKPAPTPAALSSPPSPPKSELISNHIPLIISIFIRTQPCLVLIISSAYSMYAWQFILFFNRHLQIIEVFHPTSIA